MNTPIRFLSLLVSCTIVIASCEKEDDFEPLPTSTFAPIARAGADTAIALRACNERVSFIELDGSQSSDPENDIDIYRWRKIIGPEGDTLLNATLAQARVVSLSPGYYEYELLVMDVGKQTARDTVAITITASVNAYDLDITFASIFSFAKKVQICDDWGYDNCPFYDVTDLKGQGNDVQLGMFQLFFTELADTVALSDSIALMYFEVSADDGKWLSGSSTVNFKKLIRQGGGSFNDRFNITFTSAQRCDSSVIRNMAPLAITGTLDTATKKVNLRIRGKVYF